MFEDALQCSSMEDKLITSAPNIIRGVARALFADTVSLALKGPVLSVQCPFDLVLAHGVCKEELCGWKYSRPDKKCKCFMSTKTLEFDEL